MPLFSIAWATWRSTGAAADLPGGIRGIGVEDDRYILFNRGRA